MVAPLVVAGSKDTWYTLSENLAILELLEAGQVPQVWQPLGPTTLDEITILAPLEIASARGRAKFLFDFDYVWEVYKPAEQRRWGYYTLPILYGDRLVGRLDPKLERKTCTLWINGFWLEQDAPMDDPNFTNALGKGLRRFAGFLEAERIDISVVEPEGMRAWLAKII